MELRQRRNVLKSDKRKKRGQILALHFAMHSNRKSPCGSMRQDRSAEVDLFYAKTPSSCRPELYATPPYYYLHLDIPLPKRRYYRGLGYERWKSPISVSERTEMRVTPTRRALGHTAMQATLRHLGFRIHAPIYKTTLTSRFQLPGYTKTPRD